MKAKELAEQLLKYPDYRVEFDICLRYPNFDKPWPEYASFRISGIDYILDKSNAIVLDVEEVIHR